MDCLEMNMCRGPGGPVLTSGVIRLPVSDRLRDAFADISGDKVTIGVRPEHLELGNGSRTVTTIRAADVVEYLCDEEHVHLRVDDQEIIALSNSSFRILPGVVLDLRRTPRPRPHVRRRKWSVAPEPAARRGLSR